MPVRQQSRPPLYAQIYSDLNEQIKTGALEAGDRLPSEPELAKHFNTSRGTVRQALAQLVAEGLVRREVGKGTFVNDQYLRYPTYGLLGFNRQIVASGHTPSSRLIEIREMPNIGLTTLRSFQNIGELLRIERTRLADNHVVSLERAYLPLPRFAGFKDIDLEKASIYETLERVFSIDLYEGEFELTMRTPDAREAELLEIPKGSSAFFMTGIVTDTSEMPVVHIEAYYKASAYSFQFTLGRDGSARPRF